MDRDDITIEQAKKLLEGLHPTFGHLSRLKKRLVELRYPQDDGFFRAVDKAQDAMQHVCVELHYMSCHGGTGRSRRS